MTKEPEQINASKREVGFRGPLTIPLPTVSMTLPPWTTAPRVANRATRSAALLKDMSPQPNVVPMQLAVSLAPIFHPT